MIDPRMNYTSKDGGGNNGWHQMVLDIREGQLVTAKFPAQWFL